MRKIWNWLVSLIYKIPTDKWLHFFAGVIIASFCAISLHIEWAIVPAIFAGFIKEFFDEWTTDKWDWWDFAATSFGGLLISIFQIIGFLIFK